MSESGDRPDEEALDERAFEDPAHDEVRGLLGGLRASEPVPADVAARLEATLAALQEERTAAATVVPLRRRVGRVLVAAAVLVVVGAGGVGIAQLGRNGSRDNNGATSDSAVTADRDGGAEKSVPAPSSAPNLSGTVAKGLPRLSTASFARDVSRAMRTTYGTLDTRGQSVTPTTPEPDQPKDLAGGVAGSAPAAPPVTRSPVASGDNLDSGSACIGPDAPDAVTLPATLDGGLVALVFRPPTADVQVVEAWSCDGATLLASATIPH